MCSGSACVKLQNVSVAGTPEDGQPPVVQWEADWWVPALTSDERSRDEHRARPAWVEVAERAVAETVPPGQPGSLSAPLWPFLLGVRERMADGVRRCLQPEHAGPGLLADSYVAVLRKHLLRIAL